MNPDTTTFDLGQTRLKLIDGLSFSVQQGQRQTWYLIEVEARGQYFKIGAAEYTFLSMLDGQTTLSSALASTCTLMGFDAFTENDAIQFCKWLIDVDLATTDSTMERVEAKDRPESLVRYLSKLNPISIRFPLIELDGLTSSLARYLTWLLSWPITVLWVATCTVATMCMLLSWDKIQQIDLVSRDAWFWFVATWLVLKGVHELAHVVVCKLLGGKIGKGGILFLLFIPMPYVDVTSSWRLCSKADRILVSAAGMLVEVFLAAIAAIVWCATDPGVVNFHAANIMVAASLHTLIFNANPLMRFDGYHMLADWLEIPNLGNHGNQFVMSVCRRWFFGLSSAAVQHSGFQGQIIKAYGVAALLWKVLVCIGLCIGAINLFHGIGLVIAAFGIVLWLGFPIGQLVVFVLKKHELEAPDMKRFALVVSGVCVLFFAAGNLIPAPSVFCAPVVVDFAEKTIVHTEASGFIKKIYVQDQQVVQPGDLLFELENCELDTNWQQVKLKLGKSELRALDLQNRGEIGAWQAQQALTEALKNQLVELGQLKEKLLVRAKVGGLVVARMVNDLQGQFVDAGTELVTIGSLNEKEAVALVLQQDARHLVNLSSEDTALRIWGVDGSITAKIREIEPKAIDDLPHFAFAGTCGGPIDVVERSTLEDRRETLSRGDYMMLRPRVPVRFSIASADSLKLYSGQTGIVNIRGRNESLGQYLVHSAQRWLKDKIAIGHGL